LTAVRKRSGFNFCIVGGSGLSAGIRLSSFATLLVPEQG
jgi:hypothetical protein